MDKYYYISNNERLGPFDIESIFTKIENHEISSTTKVWKEGTPPEWTDAIALDELKAKFLIVPPPLPSQAPPPIPESIKNAPVSSNTTDYYQKVKEAVENNWKLLAVIAALILAFNYFNSPNESASLSNTAPSSGEEISKEEILKRFLKVTLASKKRNYDRDVVVVFKNTSEQYTFEIPDVAIRHSVPTSSEDATVFPAVGITLEPGTTRNKVVPFPFGCVPKTAYVLLDNVTVK